MNILFVVPYVPTQIRVRPYNLIRYLSRRGHRITLLTVSTGDDEHEALEQLEQYCQEIKAVVLPVWRSLYNCILALPTNRPLQTVYSWDASLSRDCYDLASGTNGSRTIEVVHVEHLRGARYGVELKSRLSDRKLSIPVIYDSVDSISLLFRQAMMQSKSIVNRGLTWFELGRTEQYEGWLLDQFDQVLVTSEADKKALLSLRKQGGELPEVMVLPNGVDLDYFTPPEGVERERKTIVLSGKMSYHANVTMVMDFVEEIMPHVWSQQPDVRIWIVGKDPPPKMQALNQNPNIEVTGTVEDIRPYLQKATIAASPISYGVGIQNKVLEAMACSTPVIASKQAVSALDVKSGEEAIVVEDHNSFAREVLMLLNDPDRQKGLGKTGRKYVEKNHNWSVVATRLEDVYSQTLERISTGTRVN